MKHTYRHTSSGHRLILLLFALLWWWAPLIPPARAQSGGCTVQALDSRSARLFAERRWQELVQLAQQCTPPVPWAVWYRRTGIAAARAGHFALAIEQLQRALRLDSGDRISALWLQYALAMSDRYDEWYALAAEAAPAVQRLARSGPLGTTDLFGEVLWRASTQADSFPSQALLTFGFVQRPAPRWRLTHAVSVLRQPAYELPFRQTDYYLRADRVLRPGTAIALSGHALWFDGRQPQAEAADSTRSIALRQRAFALTAAVRHHRGPLALTLWGTALPLRTTLADTLRIEQRTALQGGLAVQYGKPIGRHYLRLVAEPQYYLSGDGRTALPLRVQADWQPLARNWRLSASFFAQSGMVVFGESLGYILNNNPNAARNRWSVMWQKTIGPQMIYVLVQGERKQSPAGTPFHYYSFIIGTNRSL